MLIFGTILAIIVFWTTSNVCRYNFTIEKRTNELNIIAAESLTDAAQKVVSAAEGK